MRRGAALMLGAAILAATPGAAAHAQTLDPASQFGQPPPDMPPADGARMAQLEIEAAAAVEAGDWATVERLLREGLALEQRHYAPDDARIGHSWAWLVRAAQEQGQPDAVILPMAQTRLRIAEAHPDDAATLAGALHVLGAQHLGAGRAEEALPLLTRAQQMLEGQGEAASAELRVVRTRRGMALAATGDKTQAAEVLNGVLAEMQADPAADPGDRAYVAWEAAVALHDAGRHAEAASAFEIVFQHRAGLGLTRDEAVAGYWLADTLIRLDRTAEADPVMARVVALDAAAATPEARGLTLAQVRGVVVAHGDRMRQARNLDVAEAAYRLAVQVNREQTAPGVHLASPLSRLGLVLQAKDDYAAAETAQREALALWREARGPQHGDVATQYEQLARTLMEANKHLDAMRAFGDAQAIRLALGQEAGLDVLEDQAHLAEQTDLLHTARQRREQVIARVRAESPVRPNLLADNISALAHVHYLLDDPVGAERLYVEAMPVATLPALRERIQTGLAMALTAQGRGDEAEPLQRQVLTEVTARTGAGSPEAAAAMTDLARILSLRGDKARAEAVMRDALAILEAQSPLDRNRISTVKMNLGVVASDQGRHEEALTLLGDAFRIRRGLFGAGHPRAIAAIELMLFEYVALGAYAQAEPLAAQIVRLRQDQAGSDHPILAEALQRHAYVLQNAGRPAEAEPLMRRAAAIMQRHSQNPRERIRYDANWAVTLLSSDRPAEALTIFRRAEAGLVERRRTASDPSWSRSEAASFRFLHRFAVQAAWRAAQPPPP